MKKFFSAICFLLIFAFVFSGCASVHYSFIVDGDGKVIIGFEVDLDKTAIENAGYDYQEAKNEIYEQVEKIVLINQNRIINYCSYYGKSIYNCGIKAEIKEYQEENVIYAKLSFDSKDIYKEYNAFISGSDEDDEEQEDDLLIEEHTFYNIVIQKVKNPFYDAINQSFVGELLNYFKGDEQKQTFNLNDVDYNYYYGSTENKLHSNSTYFFYQSGVKIHQWNFETTDMENDIEFYNIQIKPVAWYVLALSLTAVLLAVMGIVVYVNKLKSKNKDDTANIVANTVDENGAENYDIASSENSDITEGGSDLQPEVFDTKDETNVFDDE